MALEAKVIGTLTGFFGQLGKERKNKFIFHGIFIGVIIRLSVSNNRN